MGELIQIPENKIREIVENEKNSIIVASYGTFSTGINIRNIDNIVFASPQKAKSECFSPLVVAKKWRQKQKSQSL